MENRLELTDSAAQQVKALIEKEQNPDLMFRISVLGGGCSGFQYDFSLDANTQEDDVVFEKDGIRYVSDTASLELLKGSTVDFVKELIGSSFKIKNPNADSACGCGTSFSIKIN